MSAVCVTKLSSQPVLLIVIVGVTLEFVGKWWHELLPHLILCELLRLMLEANDIRYFCWDFLVLYF